MKENKPQSGLEFRNLDQADKERVDKMIKGGSGSVTRRDALKFALVTGVSLMAAEQLLTEGKSVIAATPKKGGSVRFASNIHGPNDNLDPVVFTSSIDYCRGRSTYNSMIQHADDLSPQPELAESFESNSDATEWNFKIRKGVEFHNGGKLTADDIVYTMKRHQGEDSKSVIKSILASVKEWKKIGPHEVKAILHSPNADLPTLLGLFQTKIVKKDTTGYVLKPDGSLEQNGTGPYRMDSFEPGVKSVHSRNENYWREGGNLDAIEMTAITDPVSRVNALVAGDVQLITVVDPKAFQQIESADNTNLTSIPAALQMGICCLKNTLPGQNDDFVKGLQYIMDRERIVKRILKGRGSVGNDHPISAAHGADFCSELAQRTYDPDKAKFHFKKAGISSARVAVAPIAVGVEDTCLLTQANCAKIGFDLQLNKVPADGYWGTVWMKDPLNVVNWNMRPTANSQMAIQFAPGAAWNDTFWNNDRMGELLKTSLATTDPDERHKQFCEMQELIHNESGMVIPAFSNINDGIASHIMGMPKVPLGQLGALEWPEYIWLA